MYTSEIMKTARTCFYKYEPVPVFIKIGTRLAAGAVAAGLLAWSGLAWAQTTPEAASAEPALPATEEIAPSGNAAESTAAMAAPEAVVSTEADTVPAVETNSVPEETVPAAGAETGAADETPAAPSKAAPTRPGSQMREPFGGAGSARFGVRRGVNPIVPPPAKERPKDAWQRHVELGVNTARGNSDLLRLDAAVGAEKETEKNALFLKAAGRYGESAGDKDTQNAAAEATYQHLLTERVYDALAANVYHDQIADLSYRVQASLSLGRHFIRTERTTFSAELGPGYVAQKKGGESEGFAAGRAAQYGEWLATPTLQLWESAEYVQNLQDSGVYYLTAEVGLETVLTGNLRLRFAVEDRYDNQPADDKERNDLLTTTSLKWKF